VGTLIFLAANKPPAPPVYLVFFAAVMAALIFFSKSMSRSDPFLEPGGPGTIRAVIYGMTLYPVLVLGLTICAGLRMPGVLICAASVLLVAFYRRLLLKRGWLRLTPFVLFALGDYFSGSFFTGLVQLKSSIVGVLTEMLLAGFFARCISAILKSNRVQAPEIGLYS
jgi:hypothetical protein